MSEQQGQDRGDEPPKEPGEIPSDAQRHDDRTAAGTGAAARRTPSRGWILGGAAALVTIGLSTAALVVALNDQSTSTTATPAPGAKSCSATTIAEQELPSVVTIQVQGPEASGTGSGEVIDTAGHILTNNHVIAAAAAGGQITVLFSNGKSEVAKLIGRDPQTDVAVLQVPDPSGLIPITFGSSAGLQVGQPVIALGAPLGLSSTVTSGIVSALDRSVDVPADDGTQAILVAAVQTDAAINPGNSGGALVDCSGDLVGVPSAGASVPNPAGGSSVGNIGIGFAIPSDFAKTIATELIQNGRATHGFLGVTVTTVPDQGTPGSAPSGLYVTSVVTPGPSASAGIQPGDVITEIAGAPATDAEQLMAVTLANRPGESVALTVQRQGAEHEATVTLGSR